MEYGTLHRFDSIGGEQYFRLRESDRHINEGVSNFYARKLHGIPMNAGNFTKYGDLDQHMLSEVDRLSPEFNSSRRKKRVMGD
jgi:hypothetical protein